MKKSGKGIFSMIRKYFILYFVIVAAAVYLLLMASTFPQYLIDRNIQESVSVFEEEGQYYSAGDKEESSTLDNFTDSIILMESAVMHIDKWNTIFSNPLYFDENPVAEFPGFLENKETADPSGYYVRYWMGFRAPVRFLLLFINYAQIRRLTAWLVFGLLITVSFYIARYTDTRSGLLFAASIILVKPQVICSSLQFSCCFVIAMAAMFFVPFIVRKGKGTEFFFALGMITMYFDFYTSPLVVLGYPLIFMLLIETRESPLIKRSLLAVSGWGTGYGIMWLTKLLFATLFTEVNGFESGFHSFAERTGIIKRAGLLHVYGMDKAFSALKRVLFPDRFSQVLASILICGMLVAAVICMIQNKQRYKQCVKYITLLFPIAVMFLWYSAASQPTAIHAFFQYRNVSMAVWGAAMYYSLFIFPVKKEILLL